MRIFFSAGESSGDMHGAKLIRALREAEPAIECVGLGGQQMAAAGMELQHDLAERAIMGFTEVLRSLGYIRKLFAGTVDYLRRTRPDGLVVIDYPGFNIRLAKRAKALGIPVVYYISPQVWAWKKGRIHTIAETVEKMLVILPFEAELYAGLAVDCTYVGHPLLDHIDAARVQVQAPDTTVIGLLPGSRAQEIGRILPIMIEVAGGILERFPEARFIAPCVDEERAAQVRAVAGGFPVETAVGGTYGVLERARFCLVASGTATLETALFDVPMVVLYKTSALTYWLAKLLVNIDHIALVNILAGGRVVPECVQYAATPKTILPLALELIADSPARERMLGALAAVREALGGAGASKKAAREVLELVVRKRRD